MEKYLNLKADHSMHGMTVEKILRKNMGLTKKQISRAKFRPDGICKNKIQCRVTEKISEGDEIRVCLETEDFEPVQLTFNEKAVKLDIIYEDEDVLVVNKQAGILTHPSGMHYSDSLSNHVSAYFRLNGLCAAGRPPGQRNVRNCPVCEKSGGCAEITGTTGEGVTGETVSCNNRGKTSS